MPQDITWHKAGSIPRASKIRHNFSIKWQVLRPLTTGIQEDRTTKPVRVWGGFRVIQDMQVVFGYVSKLSTRATTKSQRAWDPRCGGFTRTKTRPLSDVEWGVLGQSGWRQCEWFPLAPKCLRSVQYAVAHWSKMVAAAAQLFEGNVASNISHSRFAKCT